MSEAQKYKLSTSKKAEPVIGPALGGVKTFLSIRIQNQSGIQNLPDCLLANQR